MATLAQLQSRIARRLKDENHVAVSADDITTVINDSINHWSKYRFWFNEFEETVTLVSGDPSLPALSVTPEEVFQEGGIVINYAQTRWPLKKISSDEYDRINVQGNGIPFAWTYRNDGYELYWYPDAAYSAVVRGIKAYADLSDSGDNNDFTNNATNLIAYEALSRLFGEFRQDKKMESYYSNRTTNEFLNLKKRTNRNNRTGRLQIQGF